MALRIMDDDVEALLALMASYSGQRAALVERLLAVRDPLALARQTLWAPHLQGWRLAARQRRILRVLGIHCLCCWDFPPWLARVRPQPPALFVRGSLAAPLGSAISIVGARRASLGARAWAAEVARCAAGAGFVVASGGAVGIDAAAHRGALAGGGRTVAYLGVAGDRIYPEANRQLFEQILEHDGALVSEHPPLTRTFGFSHANRNRLIAGQARHLFIAEAAAASGTLSTAEYARRLGVPIWVPPAAVGGERAGIEPLIADGAAQVLSAPGVLFGTGTGTGTGPGPGTGTGTGTSTSTTSIGSAESSEQRASLRSL